MSRSNFQRGHAVDRKSKHRNTTVKAHDIDSSLCALANQIRCKMKPAVPDMKELIH